MVSAFGLILVLAVGSNPMRRLVLLMVISSGRRREKIVTVAENIPQLSLPDKLAEPVPAIP